MNGWEDVEAFALTLPGAVVGISYRQPAVRIDGTSFVSTGHEAGSFHVRSAHDDKAILLETDPATFWQTPHYANWPGLLVRYGSADLDRVRLVITRAWWDHAKAATRKAFGGRP